MKITVDEIRAMPAHRLNLEFKETLGDTACVKPVVGEVSISLGAIGVTLTGRVVSLLKLHCDRCLRPYFQSLTVELDERLVSKEYFEGESREKELQRDDFVELMPDDGVLDINDIVYQAVTLATPSYCFCGTECPGPPKVHESGNSHGNGATDDGGKPTGPTGNKKPIDPRWQNLKTLFPNQDSQENS
ncbi:MAG: DUF177 domain-containing protein [Candidatus Obscuribacterales bacterium]|nr:DUF177 domain-containing protein [Candidatus Obscuribacterales bacterium]